MSLFIRKCGGLFCEPGNAAVLLICIDFVCIAGERIGVGDDIVDFTVDVNADILSEWVIKIEKNC